MEWLRGPDATPSRLDVSWPEPASDGTGFCFLERDAGQTLLAMLEHYHLERPHQGIGNRPIEGVPKRSDGVVLRCERLGGLLSHYGRDAA